MFMRSSLRFNHQHWLYLYIPIILLGLGWQGLVLRVEKEKKGFQVQVMEEREWRLHYKDKRVRVLGEWLRYKKSPLVGYEGVFVRVADKYGLPWTLLPAIAGKESSYGRQVPYYKGKFSYNPFGWGITGGRVMMFSSWEEAIERVAYGLKTRYFDQGIDNLAAIERYYTPPSYNTNHHWLRDVSYISRVLEDKVTDKELAGLY